MTDRVSDGQLQHLCDHLPPSEESEEWGSDLALDLRDCRARCAELERELAKIKSDAADAGFVPSMWYARAVAAESAVATLRRSSDAVLAMIENGWIPPDPFPEDPPWTLERSWDEACNAFRISRAAAELRADFAATAAIPAPDGA